MSFLGWLWSKFMVGVFLFALFAFVCAFPLGALSMLIEAAGDGSYIDMVVALVLLLVTGFVAVSLLWEQGARVIRPLRAVYQREMAEETAAAREEMAEFGRRADAEAAEDEAAEFGRRADAEAAERADADMLTHPLVHIDGTSRPSLIRQYQEARDAVALAIEAVGRSAPHGRDYYCNFGHGPLDTWYAMPQAENEHQDRLRRLESVQNELAELLEVVEGA